MTIAWPFVLAIDSRNEFHPLVVPPFGLKSLHTITALWDENAEEIRGGWSRLVVAASVFQAVKQSLSTIEPARLWAHPIGWILGAATVVAFMVSNLLMFFIVIR